MTLKNEPIKIIHIEEADIAQRYGKGRAANESETKPPNLDKKPNFKTANGRRVPLTDLLGFEHKPDLTN